MVWQLAMMNFASSLISSLDKTPFITLLNINKQFYLAFQSQIDL